ncbi:hypothetical protein CPT03_16855 [Pedobacter ginsengisoli]|uniref:Uncharacterized protein n=1 Tax=Pedobacter ginsengisoli TaxID=363852 RepID=A0A2D1U8S1_9SPHI|nr:hypothetical protein [Pedobacter ginsengisoli]ATP58015.1 hypothetical protein CPT03_16855 [Pedobacter ginsengisoli]
MENAVKASKYKIINELKSLDFIKDILLIEPKVRLCGELEIEPYVEFSVNFQADYWYIKYLLLRDQYVDLTNEFESLFSEPDLNIIWLRLTDGNTFVLEFNDGQPFLSFLKENTLMKNYFELFTLSRL